MANRKKLLVMAPPDDEAPVRWPNLFQLLTQRVWQNAKQRFTAQVTLSMGLGLYQVAIRCPDPKEGLQKAIPLAKLGDCWDALEAAVLDPSIPWQEYAALRGTRRRRDMAKDPE